MAWQDVYRDIVTTLAKKNGSYDNATPKMTAKDMTAVLGMFTVGVYGAIERASDRIVRSDFATSEGLLNVLAYGALGRANASIDFIDARAYVSSTTPLKDAAWKRTPTKLTDEQQAKLKLAGIKVATYEPVRDPNAVRNEQTEQIFLCRQLMADYQRGIDAGANAWSLYAVLTYYANSNLCKSFLSPMRALASDLDIMAENPPTSFSQDLAGALNAAKNESEKALVSIGNAAGKAAAELGNVAGQVAGSFGEGFFSRATLLTIAVAGVAAYIAFK